MVCLSWLPEERQENIIKVKYFLTSIFHAAAPQPGAGKLPADLRLNLTSNCEFCSRAHQPALAPPKYLEQAVGLA